MGENDILLDLLDGDGARLPVPGPSASVDLVGPDGLVRPTIPLERIGSRTGAATSTVRAAPWMRRVGGRRGCRP
ncbi:MAG: hypothetical protein R3C32_00870 [Chloroflexota bacterium]